MDSDDSATEAVPVDVVFSVHSIESSEDPPMEEWSSLEILVPEENKKKCLYNEGLYDPGSGEMCGKYITMSDSSVFRHLYFNYPAITDPGIENALLKPADAIIYPDDGQALYLAVCKEMDQCPVRSFYRGLLGSRIDLRYYCINPNGFRAMAKALQYNKIVKVIDLTDNFLNDDACYHMGELLLINNTITELYLRGCRIGREGARRLFSSLHLNKALKVLDLSYNKLGDEAMEYLGNAILFGLTVKNLNLSYNDITGKGVALLEEPFEIHNNFTHLDLSWNKIYNSVGGYAFLLKLSESICLEDLNLAWNSLSGARIGLALTHILLCPRLNELNLSNNKLDGYAITPFIGVLRKAKKLNTLNLSYNPLTPRDALFVMHKVALVGSKVKNVLLENVAVTEQFISLLNRTKLKKSKKNLVVTYGSVASVFKAKGPDARDTVLNRVEYVTKKGKKNKTDIALIALQIQKEGTIHLNAKELTEALQRAGAHLDEDLVNELCNVFPGPPSKNAKIKVININSMVEYIRRKWPDRKLPLTPPPEPEPEPEPEPPKKEKRKRKK